MTRKKKTFCISHNEFIKINAFGYAQLIDLVNADALDKQLLPSLTHCLLDLHVTHTELFDPLVSNLNAGHCSQV